MKNKHNRLLSYLYLAFLLVAGFTASGQKQLRVVIAGLNHDHVNGLLWQYSKGELAMTILGIAEPDPVLRSKYAQRYHLPDSLFGADLARLVKARHPDAVWAFNAAAAHLAVVTVCAPLSVTVMVEKPLAATLKQAKAIQQLSERFHIPVVINYETTWYTTNMETYQLVAQGKIGIIRKMVAHDGHQGPVERGCSPQFLSWLTDPLGNGAGALNDFGCYGADLMTWLMKGERPLTVTAILRHYKPLVYPKVDDDATVFLKYRDAIGIIEGSWNWPYSIKDFEVFGDKGYVHAADDQQLLGRLVGDEHIKDIPKETPAGDPVSYLAAIVKGEQNVPGNELSSLSYNMIVMEILDAAKRSAKTRKPVTLSATE